MEVDEASVSIDDGVVVPMPMFPFERIVKSDVPDEDATLNGLIAALPCTLNEYEDEVALIPATVPLSSSDDVPSVVDVIQRVANPVSPPDTPEAVIFNDVVDTHSVDVPVDHRI